VLTWIAAPAGLLAAVGALWGAPAAALGVAQAAVAILLLEDVNYVEHYGLTRARAPSGMCARPAPACVRHPAPACAPRPAPACAPNPRCACAPPPNAGGRAASPGHERRALAQGGRGLGGGRRSAGQAGAVRRFELGGE
jgi:hypothetical protein